MHRSAPPRTASPLSGRRRTLRRPATTTAPAFDLTYVRRRPGAGPVVLLIPGGPGVAVPLPYWNLRERAAREGLDVIMVEHRGVGLSRHDTRGQDLPAAALSVPQVVEDLLAVLDAEGIGRAIVCGSSYGSYLAGAFAVTHPERVSGLVLDAPVLGAQDYRTVRAYARAMLWSGDADGIDPATARVAGRIRTLVQRDGADPLPLGAAALALFDLGGPALLERYLDQRVVSRAPLTRWVLSRTTGAGGAAAHLRHLLEPDLVAPIAFGELGFASPPDGGIFDPGYTLGSDDAPEFTGEHYDLEAQLARVTCPAVVLCGDQDLITPLPIARRVAAALPDATLVVLPGHGHSALDARPGALLAVLSALADGRQASLPSRARQLVEHGGSGPTGLLRPALRALLAVDRTLRPRGRSPRGLR